MQNTLGNRVRLILKAQYSESATDPVAAEQKGHRQQGAHRHCVSLTGSPLLKHPHLGQHCTTLLPVFGNGDQDCTTLLPVLGMVIGNCQLCF